MCFSCAMEETRLMWSGTINMSMLVGREDGDGNDEGRAGV